MFVLGATADPITPIEGARSIADRLADGYLITTLGGPHVTFGRGDTCVDAPVVGFLIDGRRPQDRSIDCRGEVVAGYVGLTPEDLAGYEDGLSAMRFTEAEMFADPQVSFWNGDDDLQVGCRYGGFFTMTDLTNRDNLRFASCQFVAGLPVTGIGTYELATGAMHWDVKVPDGVLV